MRVFFIFLLVVFSAHTVSAQHPYFYTITDENGLPSNEVYQVVQDNFGYIWIGCDAGLFRYDGFTFKPYTNMRQNGRSISFLHFDKKGRLWCKNFSGQIYRVEKDSLRIIKDLTGRTSSLSQFALDDDCNLYIANLNAIEVCTENGDSIREYLFPARDNRIVDITELTCYKGKLFFCRYAEGFYALNLNSGKTSKLECENGCGNFWSRNLFKVMDDQLYILAENAGSFTTTIGKVNDRGIEMVSTFNKENDSNRGYMIYSDGSRNKWICSDKGVSTFNGYAEKEFLLPGEKVSSMLHDREGNYWFSTLEHGLFVIPSLDVMKLNTLNAGLREDNFTSVTVLENGKIYAGSYSGELAGIEPGIKGSKSIFGDKDQKFIAVKKIRETKEYILISRGRFCIAEKKTGTCYYPKLSNFRDMVLLGDTLFFVMPEAAAKISIKDLLLNKPPVFMPVGKGGGRAVEADTVSGSVYFALNGGSFVYKNGRLDELKDGNEQIFANSASFSDGILWLASVSGGIYGFQENNVKYHFTTGNGLRENTMRCIKASGKNVVACSGNFLYRIEPRTGNIATYNHSSGIIPGDINAIDLSDKMVFLATNKGLVYFPISLQHTNEVQPGISITNVMHGSSIADHLSTVYLPYHNNNLKISLSSAAFRSRGDFTYEYRIKELDTNWVSVPASAGYVVISLLPPGDFVFEVRAVNESGVKSAETASIVFQVSSPVWQQWWFYLLVTLLSIGLVVIIYQLRIRFLKRRAVLENKLTASQLTALKAQMNPHFMYNALNSIQDLILQSDIKNTNYYLSRFSSLMRKVLDASGSNEIVLADEIEMLELYLELEKLRFGNEFSYCISVESSIDRDEIKLPSMVLQLFVENAIKHGLLHKKGEKELLVEFSVANGTLRCVVTDNGVGRKRSMEIRQRSAVMHESFATKATEKRLELINSSRVKKIKLEVIDLMEEGKALGTKVVLEIPL